MKKTKKQMVIDELMAGEKLTTKDIAESLSKITNENVTIQSVGTVLTQISDEKKCALGFFIDKDIKANPYTYIMVPEALKLSGDQANNLTLKAGKYSLEQALKDFPGLKKYTESAPAPVPAAKGKVTGTGKIYRIKITLGDIAPPIWRRVEVKDDITLDELHDIIQTAMGWDDYHLHQFIVDRRFYGVPDPNFMDDTEDERKIKLSKIAPKENFKFMYEYDFGDGWLHLIHIEKILPAEQGKKYPVCIKGKRACPPEDVGGIWGYQSFLEAVTDKKNPEHEEMLDWVGGSFDPEKFDIDEVNKELKSLQ